MKNTNKHQPENIPTNSFHLPPMPGEWIRFECELAGMELFYNVRTGVIREISNEGERALMYTPEMPLALKAMLAYCPN